MSVLGATCAPALAQEETDLARKTVNQTLIQPFASYNLPHGWYLTSSPSITANWNADDGDTWTVPVGAGAGKIQRIGKLPVNFQLAPYYNAVRPDRGPEWNVRFLVQFLVPAR